MLRRSDADIPEHNSGGLKTKKKKKAKLINMELGTRLRTGLRQVEGLTG